MDWKVENCMGLPMEGLTLSEEWMRGWGKVGGVRRGGGGNSNWNVKYNCFKNKNTLKCGFWLDTTRPSLAPECANSVLCKMLPAVTASGNSGFLCTLFNKFLPSSIHNGCWNAHRGLDFRCPPPICGAANDVTTTKRWQNWVGGRWDFEREVLILNTDLLSDTYVFF